MSAHNEFRPKMSIVVYNINITNKHFSLYIYTVIYVFNLFDVMLINMFLRVNNDNKINVILSWQEKCVDITKYKYTIIFEKYK